MAQTIQVTSRKFFSQLKNGENFSLNTGDFASHLLGSIGERVRADITFTISWNSKASPYSAFYIDFSTNTITRQSGSFIDDGFRIGDLFDANNEDPSITNYVAINGGTITFINDTTIVYTGGTETGSSGNYGYLNIKGRTSLAAIKYYYGIVENSQPAVFISKLDGTSQGFYASGLSASPTVGNILGIPKSWFFDDVISVTKVSSTTYTQTFNVVHDFVITPFFLDGEQTNIENVIEPNYFAQTESLKYVFQADLNTVLSNPNTVHTFVDDLLLGEVAYYNENFNGFPNIFSSSNLLYRNPTNLTGCDGLLITEKTRVSFTLNASSGVFTDNVTPLIISVFYLCPQSEYTNTNQTDGAENFIFYQKRTVCDSTPTPVSNGDITNFTATFISATEIDVDFNFELTPTEAARLTTSGQFCISVIVANDSLTSVLSDKVNLIIDVNNYDLFTDVYGLMSFSRKSSLWIHPLNPLTSSGFTSIRTWIEDAFYSKAFCRLNYIQYPNANIVSITPKIIAYNSNDGRNFELDSYEFNLSGVQTINGVQQININAQRPFQLVNGDTYLNATIEMGTGLAASYQDYDITVGWKMRYEDFFSNPNVPSDFFDSAETNNNQNYKASNYVLAPDWEVGVVYDIVINNGTPNVDTLYRYHFATNDIHDYDEDGNVTPNWSCVIKLYRESNNALISTGSTGLILENENTIVEAEFTPLTGTGSLLNPWAVLRIENLNSGYNSIFELSSVTGRGYLPNSPLIPLNTFTKAVIQQGATVKVYGRIDFTKVNASDIYKISARLGGVQFGGSAEAFRREGILSDEIFIIESGEILRTE